MYRCTRTTSTTDTTDIPDTWRGHVVQWRNVCLLPVSLTVLLTYCYRSTIRITLENVSELPVDLIHLTFDDSTIAPAQQALAEGDLSVFDTYETEYDLVHRPVFTWDSEREAQEIGPGQKKVITVNCFGKVGW